MSPIRMLCRHQAVLVSVVSAELRKKYAGSVLGWAWLAAYPVLFLAIYAGVYLLIFKVRIPEFSSRQYVLVVFSGLVPYLGFCDALQQGSQSLVRHSHLLKNTVFPIELIPVKTVLCSQVTFVVMLAVLFGFIMATGPVDGGLWLVPVLIVLQFLLVQGFVWMLAALTVIIKDVPHVLNLLLLAALFISPIAFMPSMVPAAFRFLLYGNPLYYLISLYRASFFPGIPFFVSDLLILTAMSASFFLAGFVFFRRFQEVLAEYV